MNRMAIGALCAAVCLLSAIEAKRIRRALATFALEKVEHVFDAVENTFHLA
jgi:hypothetical protein